MTLSNTKINIQKGETKDELQTNGSCKIRQIKIEIIQNAHIHIHPATKTTTTTKRKQNKKENSTELQKPNVEAEVYHSNKNVAERKKKTQKLNWIS